MAVGAGNGGHAVNLKQEAESELEMVQVLKPSKPASTDNFYPKRPHLLSLPKQCHHMETKGSNTGTCGGQVTVQTRAGVKRMLLLEVD